MYNASNHSFIMLFKQPKQPGSSRHKSLLCRKYKAPVIFFTRAKMRPPSSLLFSRGGAICHTCVFGVQGIAQGELSHAILYVIKIQLRYANACQSNSCMTCNKCVASFICCSCRAGRHQMFQSKFVCTLQQLHHLVWWPASLAKA